MTSHAEYFSYSIGVYLSWLGETERKWNGSVTVTAVILAPILGEEDALLDGFGGEIRSVSRDQNILEHRVLLPALFLSAARRWSHRITGPQEP
jgi:hypothetical protein